MAEGFLNARDEMYDALERSARRLKLELVEETPPEAEPGLIMGCAYRHPATGCVFTLRVEQRMAEWSSGPAWKLHVASAVRECLGGRGADGLPPYYGPPLAWLEDDPQRSVKRARSALKGVARMWKTHLWLHSAEGDWLLQTVEGALSRRKSG